eukprot:4545079-Amphidinium_carterae.1
MTVSELVSLIKDGQRYGGRPRTCSVFTPVLSSHSEHNHDRHTLQAAVVELLRSRLGWYTGLRPDAPPAGLAASGHQFPPRCVT